MKRNEKKGIGPMDAAMHYLGYSARTVREMERYLDGKEYGEVEIMETVDRLQELGLLDDRKYALDFIDSRLRTKPVSKAHLKEQLFHHEISGEIISEALDTVDEERETANALLLARKFFGQFEGLEEEKRRERLLRRVISHGFSYGDAQKAYTVLLEEEEENDTPHNG